MKNGIDTLHVIRNEDDRKSIEEILFGEPLESLRESGFDV